MTDKTKKNFIRFVLTTLRGYYPDVDELSQKEYEELAKLKMVEIDDTTLSYQRPMYMLTQKAEDLVRSILEAADV